MADGARIEDIKALTEFSTFLARFREDLIEPVMHFRSSFSASKVGYPKRL